MESIKHRTQIPLDEWQYQHLLEVSLSLDDEELLAETFALRTRYCLKLPDAVIGATALTRNSLIVTNDSHFAASPHLAIQGC